MSTAVKDARSTKPLTHGRDEITWSLFPLSVLTHQQPTITNGQKEYKRTFSSKRWDADCKAYVPQSVTLISNHDHGLPVPFDEGMTLALIALSWQQHRLKEDKTTFQPAQLIRTMALSRNGDRYRQVAEGLARLSAIRIIYENAHWDHQTKQYDTTFNHGIIATYKFHRPRQQSATAKTPPSWIRWNKDFLSQLEQGVLSSIDLQKYFALKRPVARRMMRVVNRELASRDHYESDLHDFACGHVGLADSYDVGQIKRQLNNGYDELQEQQLVNPKSRDERYRKVKKGIWRIAFETYQESTDETDQHISQLQQALTDRGVNVRTAKRLLKNYPTEAVQLQIEHYDFLKSTNDPTAPQKSGPWLKQAIEQDYIPPDTFMTAAEREAEQLKRKAKQQSRQTAEDARRQQQQADTKRLADYWHTLTQPEQDELEQQAFGSAPSFLAQRHKKAIRQADEEQLDEIRELIINAYLRKLLVDVE